MSLFLFRVRLGAHVLRLGIWLMGDCAVRRRLLWALDVATNEPLAHGEMVDISSFRSVT